MRTGTVSYKLEDLKKGVIIPIGFVGENDFTKVFFDAEEIYKKYPSASVSMKVQPPKGGIYPTTVTRDGNTVIWQVKEADVANRGGGELQLTFTDGETKIKTYIAKTDVKRSLTGNGPAPDPIQDWIDDADEKLAEVEQALDDLAAMDNIAKTAQASDIGKALSPKTVENGVVTEWEYITPGGGTEDYTDLDNKPSIAGVTLSGNKTLEDLGIAADDDLDNLEGEVSDVKTAIQGKYTLPSGGIPATDLSSGVQTSLGLANTAYQKPANGIPASDIASGVIPYLTPEMYGAKGDGVTDDSSAIGAMFAVASPMYVMNGDYICDSEIRLQNKKNITIIGTGSIYKNSTAANSRLFDFLECENIHVEGLTFKSINDKTPDSPGEHSVRTGALLSNVHAFTIDNSSFITFAKLRFVQIGYCFTIGTWNTASSEADYRTRNICMNDIEMKNCGMGIYCQNISDLSITDWIFDDMAISPGGYHMFYGTTKLKNINLTNLAFNGNAYSDDVILIESATQQEGEAGSSNIIVDNITAKCSHFASTEPNTCMIIKNAIIAMHNHYSEDMVSGNSSIIMTYYDSNTAPNVVFENCTIYHVDGTDKPLIAMQEMNVNLQFINCDIRLNVGAYAVHNVLFHNCKMSGRRLVNTSLSTTFKTNVTFKECDIIAQGYSVIFDANGKLILDSCRFKTNHTRVIHSTAQKGSIYGYYNIVDSSSSSCVFGLDSTYITDYRDLDNTVYANSQ